MNKAGEARFVGARHCASWQGRLGVDGIAEQVMVRLEKAGLAGPDRARHGRVWLGSTRHGRQGKFTQNKTKK